ncbi:hypothetical protein KGF54_002069 [Candida jiufengensis]|uniref:uncharacterized protein n=1 Tax=Candida jiufengensis TaxID=497108 RepID=UPI002224F401|nr:uncharacterized protein KGF54_002069 [Candida jiufengensis]KAI5954294.1 hypothetical protein KGF54_002069 [Candida jiufengensis]
MKQKDYRCHSAGLCLCQINIYKNNLNWIRSNEVIENVIHLIMRYGGYSRGYGGSSSYGYGSSSSYGNYSSNRQQYNRPVASNKQGTLYTSDYYRNPSNQRQSQYKQNTNSYGNTSNYNNQNYRNQQNSSYKQNQPTNVNQNVTVNKQGKGRFGMGRVGGFFKWPFMFMMFNRMGKRHHEPPPPPPQQPVVVNVHGPPPQDEQLQTDLPKERQLKSRTLISKNNQYAKDTSPISEHSQSSNYETRTFGHLASDNNSLEVNSTSSFRGENLVSSKTPSNDNKELKKPYSQQTIDMKRLLQSTPPADFNNGVEFEEQCQTSFQP